MSRPSLLFISPITPAAHGNGLAMRAAACLKALARHCDLYLLVVPLADPTCVHPLAALEIPCKASRLVAIPRIERALAGVWGHVTTLRINTTGCLPAERVMASPRMIRQAFQCFSHVTFDRVFVFRAYMAPFARPYIDTNPRAICHLDLDDIESLTRQRLVVLHAANGQTAQARRLTSEAVYYQRYERDITKIFHSVSVCSLRDRDQLHARLGLTQVEVLQNTVEGTRTYHPPPAQPPFNLLFVGNLGYYPNQDAIRFFVGEILPRIRANTDVPVRFTLVGSGNATWTRAIPRVDCDMVGQVENLAAYYLAAHAVVVPLRAGGGTRVKILEAFSYHRPVISTSIGAEGLAVRHERDLLLADTPDDFAQQCLRLIDSPSLAANLAVNAAQGLDEYYSGAALEAVLTRLLRIP